MIIDKLVVRFKDKTLIKGMAKDFSFYKSYFTMKLLDGEEVKVKVDMMKAAFIVKSFAGNQNYKYKYEDNIPYAGPKVKVEFIDGEIMIGYNVYDIYGPYGFFMQPADLQGNNKCVFVVASSIRELTMLEDGIEISRIHNL
ncbi:MAG: hypothetical protein AB1499_08395 [Nitrospirota bacterium]